MKLPSEAQVKYLQRILALVAYTRYIHTGKLWDVYFKKQQDDAMDALANRVVEIEDFLGKPVTSVDQVNEFDGHDED